jgi:dTDP-4-dehydrorhamnose reductase
MNILLTGVSGQLGHELQPQLQQLGRVSQVDQVVEPGDRETLEQDLGDLGRVEILLNRTRPDIIVNAAAYTAVDPAEDDHYSTDYVFSGDASRPYTEQDPTGPLGVYGHSKLAGERAIAASHCRHIILRTSWVYSSRGNNFVLTMLRLARERSSLGLVSDQTACPTWARNLVGVTRKIIAQSAADGMSAGSQGLYHYCDGEAVSWYEFARAIFSAAMEAGLLQQAPDMTRVKYSDYPQKAERPLYSVLDTSKIRKAFGVEPARLKQALQSCLGEMEENEL